MEPNQQDVQEQILTPKQCKHGNLMYIIEAAVEYFISLLITGSYLAKVSTAIGISDAVTGVLTSFVSLGCTFQIFALFLSRKRRVKRFIIVWEMIAQSLYMFVYIVPLVKISTTMKHVIFVGVLLFGHLMEHLTKSPKTAWFMSLVDPHKRGKFTAIKEIVSLIGGITVTTLAGNMMTYFEKRNDLKTAFIICGISIFVFMVIHAFTLISTVSVEQKTETHADGSKVTIGETAKEMFTNRTLVLIIASYTLYKIVTSSTVSFFGTFQNNDLKFSMSFIAILTAIGSIVRAVASIPLGKFADKYSFRNLLILCYSLFGLSLVPIIFATPENGKVTFIIFRIVHDLGMGGITSGSINIIYDNFNKSKAVNAMAIKNAISGSIGFLSSVLAGVIVARIQANGGIFGMNIYAHNFLSFIGVILTGVNILILAVFLKKKPRDKTRGSIR